MLFCVDVDGFVGGVESVVASSASVGDGNVCLKILEISVELSLSAVCDYRLTSVASCFAGAIRSSAGST